MTSTTASRHTSSLVRRAARLAPLAAAFLALLLADGLRAQEAGERGGAASAGAAAAGETAIVIHGGAGTILPENMSDEEEAAYRAKLREALMAGHGVLERGGPAVDAVIAAIRVMEESPLFNAGVGAVFTSEGTVEHDASIMDGKTRNSGAVTGVSHVPSPIRLARLVMDSSRHVFLAQEGAETFARNHGIDMVPNETFYTERRRRAWERERGRDRDGGSGPSASAAAATSAPASPAAGRAEGASGAAAATAEPADPRVVGTVGAAALDRDGNLAAGTSTGGISNKRFGRIGDSPVIGAGTYADNETAAISATGHGEYFIRSVVAHDIASMMRYAGLPLVAAANAVVHGKLVEFAGEGSGGVIALDRKGNIAMPFNTPGMYRGYVDTDGDVVVRIYRN